MSFETAKDRPAIIDQWEGYGDPNDPDLFCETTTDVERPTPEPTEWKIGHMRVRVDERKERSNCGRVLFGDETSAHELMAHLNGKVVPGAVVVRTGRQNGYIVKTVVLESTSGASPLTQNAGWRVLQSVLDGWTLKPHDCHGLAYEVLRGNVTLRKVRR